MVPDGAILNEDGFYVLDGRIYNEMGYVAMKHKRQQRIAITCHGRGYIFAIRANIPLSWVLAEDVDCALAVRGGCCGQKKPGVIGFANESDVRRWTNNGGR